MFLENKRRGKKGIFVLTQNLVIIILILVLIGVVGYIIYKFSAANLIAQP